MLLESRWAGSRHLLAAPIVRTSLQSPSLPPTPRMRVAHRAKRRRRFRRFNAPLLAWIRPGPLLDPEESHSKRDERKAGNRGFPARGKGSPSPSDWRERISSGEVAGGASIGVREGGHWDANRPRGRAREEWRDEIGCDHVTDLLDRHVVKTMDHVPTKECVKLRAMLRTKAKRTAPRMRWERSSMGTGGHALRTVSGVSSSTQSTRACVS